MKRYKWEAEDWVKFFATTPRMTLTDGQREFLRQMRLDPLPDRPLSATPDKLRHFRETEQ